MFKTTKLVKQQCMVYGSLPIIARA